MDVVVRGAHTSGHMVCPERGCSSVASHCTFLRSITKLKCLDEISDLLKPLGLVE